MLVLEGIMSVWLLLSVSGALLSPELLFNADLRDVDDDEDEDEEEEEASEDERDLEDAEE